MPSCKAHMTKAVLAILQAGVWERMRKWYGEHSAEKLGPRVFVRLPGLMGHVDVEMATKCHRRGFLDAGFEEVRLLSLLTCSSKHYNVTLYATITFLWYFILLIPWNHGQVCSCYEFT